MISLKNYRGKRGIKSRGQRKEEKKKEKTATPNHGMERSLRRIKLCLESHR
jgi:hypothetical protein